VPLTLALDSQHNNRERQDQAGKSMQQADRVGLGRFTLWRMNLSHSELADCGLEQVSITHHDTILDVG
jgi:hypothetical protein